MPITAVTFDFHNTLVLGAAWLHLEIYTLPCVVLERLVGAGYLPPETAGPEMLAAAERSYRAVREGAKSSGREVSAFSGTRQVLRELGLRPPLLQVRAAVTAAQRACLADTAPVPGAQETLAALREVGLRLAVVSSAAYTPFVHLALARHGLLPFFSIVATSASTGYYKSDPRLYAWALACLGADPAHAVHIGDHPRFDVIGAQAAGMRAVLFSPPTPWPYAAAPPDCRPDAVLANLRELPRLLAGF